MKMVSHEELTHIMLG